MKRLLFLLTFSLAASDAPQTYTPTPQERALLQAYLELYNNTRITQEVVYDEAWYSDDEDGVAETP